MLIFRKALIFSIAVTAISPSLNAAPQLFKVVDEVPAQTNNPLYDFKERRHSVQLIEINKDILLRGATSFLFNRNNQGQVIEFNGNLLNEDGYGIKVWQGNSGDDKSTAIFSVRNDKVNGFVRLNDGSFYEIHPISEELHALVKIETSGGDENEFDYIKDDENEPDPLEYYGQSNNTFAKVRVLYAYTNQSRYKFGDSPELYASTLNSALNLSHEKSKSLARFDVAGILDTKVSETNMNNLLADMKNTSTGLGAVIAQKRKETRADLIVLITALGGGLAYMPGMYSVVSASQAIASNTLAHEIGHNFGLNHGENENGITAYANGYRVAGEFSTVMSKRTSGGTAINSFSNPQLNHNGIPIGTATSNDAVRLINERRFIVANYFPDWENKYTLNAGELPPRQFFEITLTDITKNEQLTLDKIISNSGGYTWPYEVSIAVNNFFPHDVVMAGELLDGKISPIIGSSYRNNIWLNLDKKDKYHLEVNRKTYAIYNGTNWMDVINISGGNGLPAHSTATAIVKDKLTGQIVEQFTFANEDVGLDHYGWPHKLAEVINNKNSSYLRAGEMKENGEIGIVNGSSYRNRLWLPLDKKNNLTIDIVITKNK
ncbi:zinc-dependent metalloprotease family protein [Enterobacter bugandensis]|uniref:zinc-dependent metalloprotease family protein n=1 Tax=Enterobacter bugandensis TaxID=881260 RepID=UPI00236196EB|nr:zinc-dependent metalloprotease family protein [Enterobacter bugandensis]